MPPPVADGDLAFEIWQSQPETRIAPDLRDEEKGSAALGIVVALLLALPLWALIAFTVYLIA